MESEDDFDCINIDLSDSDFDGDDSVPEELETKSKPKALTRLKMILERLDDHKKDEKNMTNKDKNAAEIKEESKNDNMKQEETTKEEKKETTNTNTENNQQKQMSSELTQTDLNVEEKKGEPLTVDKETQKEDNE